MEITNVTIIIVQNIIRIITRNRGIVSAIYAQIHMYSNDLPWTRNCLCTQTDRDSADSEINLSCDVEYIA